MYHTSYIELDPVLMKQNLDFLHQVIGKETIFSMVVKANAFGHGIEPMVSLAEENGVRHFSVFSIAEAQRVVSIKQKQSNIMIMGWVPDEHLDWVIEKEVSFFIFTQERLKASIEAAKKAKKPAMIHLELETGMYRTGFCDYELDDILKIIKNNEQHLRLEGLCTHYAGAENLVNHERVEAQIRLFHELCDHIENKGLQFKYKHSACSAAVFLFPETIMDMVRIGISSYGFWPNAETQIQYIRKHELKENPLKRVLSWKSVLLSVNKVPEGKYISYGKSYLTNRPSKIGTIPVGYGYGFSRTLSNNGHVLINKKRIPVIGAVNMNMMVVDVTDLEEVSVGDEVVLVGRQGDLEIGFGSFSDMNNSMNYELLTRLPEHIPRFVLGQEPKSPGQENNSP